MGAIGEIVMDHNNPIGAMLLLLIVFKATASFMGCF
jgi:hypothetical protein